MKKIKLSGFIVVRNEEKNIERCLRSLDFCDEIIVVDQESTDKTVKIARKYTKNIYHDKCWGYADPSRKLGASKCKGRWILNLDADEEITNPLKLEILDAIKKNTADAYYIHREIYFLEKKIVCVSETDYVLRLHKKNTVTYVSNIHVCVIPKKNIIIKKLKESMNHYATTSIKQALEKIRRYAKIQAKTDKKYNSFPRKYFGIFYTPIYYFVYIYFIKKGFLNGQNGFIYACMDFYYQILIYRYLWFK